MNSLSGRCAPLTETIQHAYTLSLGRVPPLPTHHSTPLHPLPFTSYSPTRAQFQPSAMCPPISDLGTQTWAFNNPTIRARVSPPLPSTLRFQDLQPKKLRALASTSEPSTQLLRHCWLALSPEPHLAPYMFLAPRSSDPEGIIGRVAPGKARSLPLRGKGETHFSSV